MSPACVANIKVYFTFIWHFFMKSLPAIRPSHCWVRLILPSASQSRYCFLSTWLEDGFKDKELLYNVWKFSTRSFSHWRATTLQLNLEYLSIGYKTGFHRFSHICYMTSPEGMWAETTQVYLLRRHISVLEYSYCIP